MEIVTSQSLSRHDFHDLSYFVLYRCYKLDLGVDFTVFQVGELKNKEENVVQITRNLESDCYVTISVTCRIYSNTNDTISKLVSISPYSRSRISKIMRLFM